MGVDLYNLDMETKNLSDLLLRDSEEISLSLEGDLMKGYQEIVAKEQKQIEIVKIILTDFYVNNYTK